MLKIDIIKKDILLKHHSEAVKIVVGHIINEDWDAINRWNVFKNCRRILDVCRSLGIYSKDLEDHLYFLSDEAQASK